MTAREPAILGIDLGTNEVKSGLVTLDGRLLASARAGYATDLGRQPGWAEQDPGAWWAALTETTRELAALDVADIVAVCADGHGPTLVAVDATGHPTRPAITWLDTRAGSEADELAARTGVRGWALGGLPAALWVERHEPAVAAANGLVPDDVGVPRAAADRTSRSRRWSRTSSCPTRQTSTRPACRGRSCLRPGSRARSSAR